MKKKICTIGAGIAGLTFEESNKKILITSLCYGKQESLSLDEGYGIHFQQIALKF